MIAAVSEDAVVSEGTVVIYATWLADVRAQLEALGHPVWLTTDGPREAIRTTVEGARAIGRGPYVDPLPEGDAGTTPAGDAAAEAQETTADPEPAPEGDGSGTTRTRKKA